jgi:hypothetical protein
VKDMGSTYEEENKKKLEEEKAKRRKDIENLGTDLEKKQEEVDVLLNKKSVESKDAKKQEENMKNLWVWFVVLFLIGALAGHYGPKFVRGHKVAKKPAATSVVKAKPAVKAVVSEQPTVAKAPEVAPVKVTVLPYHIIHVVNKGNANFQVQKGTVNKDGSITWTPYTGDWIIPKTEHTLEIQLTADYSWIRVQFADGLIFGLGTTYKDHKFIFKSKQPSEEAWQPTNS